MILEDVMKRILINILFLCIMLLSISCSTLKAYQSREIPENLLEYEKYATDYVILDDGKLHFYFIAASNGYVRTSYKTGDSCLVLFPNGEKMLIDCCVGSYTPVLITSLLKLGVSDIDYLVLTHPHSDHCGGIYQNETWSILDYCNVKKLFYTGIDCEINKKIIQRLDDRGIPYKLLLEGSEFNVGDVHLNILNPPESVVGSVNSEEEYQNSSSITIRYDYGDFSALFTGDLYIPAEYRLVDKYSSMLDVDLLKVCHHGRNTSSSEKFISAVTPSLSIVTGNCTMDTTLYSLFKKYGSEVFLDFCDGYIHVWSDGKTMDTENSIERSITLYDSYDKE